MLYKYYLKTLKLYKKYLLGDYQKQSKSYKKSYLFLI